MREGLPDAAIREVREETGLEVNPFPYKVLCVEEFLSRKYRQIKIWLLCSLVGGTLTKTLEAKQEGIIEIGWYSQSEVASEVLYPSILMTTDWQEFMDKNWQTKYLELHEANF